MAEAKKKSVPGNITVMEVEEDTEAGSWGYI